MDDWAVALGSSGVGFVRKRQQSQTRDVHVTLPRREGNRRRRPSLSVAGQDPISLPSDVHSAGRVQQDTIRSPVQDFPGPFLVAALPMDPGPEFSSASILSHTDVGTSAALGSRASGSASVEPSCGV